MNDTKALLHQNQCTRVALVLLTLGGNLLSCGEPLPLTTTSVALRQRCSTGASIVPAVATAAIDGDEATGYRSNNHNWQNVVVDLGCEVPISGVRRKMTGSGATRGLQGEGFAISRDGQTWTTLLGSTTSGWSAYANYRPHAWHSVVYGWSRWLRLGTTSQARYVRFSWDGNGDALDEIEIDTRSAFASASAVTGRADDVLDGDPQTGFRSSSRAWQYIEVDLGETIHLTALRRHMSGNGAHRGLKGEYWEISEDGSSWTRLTTAEVEGWDAYINYRPHAWHSVSYGWSDWLELRQPARVRNVRFRWDGAGDRLDEIEFSRTLVGADQAYDFDPNESSHRVDPRVWPAGPIKPPSSGIVISPQPTTAYDLGHRIGVTGMYHGWVSPQPSLPSGYCSGGGGRSCWSTLDCRAGEVCFAVSPPGPPPNVTARGGRTRATLSLTESSGEVRGYLRINESGLVYNGGALCGETMLDVGSELAVRMRGSSDDGRFSNRLSSLRVYPGPFTQRFLAGQTARTVDRFAFSGTVRTTFTAAVDIKQHQAVGQHGFRTGTQLFGLVIADMPSPCPDARLALEFERQDGSLMRGLGW